MRDRSNRPTAIKKSELYSSLWALCNALRGGMDASQYKDYVPVLLFIKYVSDKYAGVFERAERELQSGVRKSLRFGQEAGVNVGAFFVLSGQMVYVAEKGEETKTPNGTPDARLRVIYSNGTESDLLMRSLQRALYKDETGRRLTGTDEGPLFGGEMEDGDAESGTIYVLRSLSESPYVAEHRDLIHKIGVTGARSKREPQMPSTMRPICWLASRSWRPTSCRGSTGSNWKTYCIASSRPPNLTSPSRIDSVSRSNRANGSWSRCLPSTKLSNASATARSSMQLTIPRLPAWSCEPRSQTPIRPAEAPSTERSPACAMRTQ